jgi:hypothetical protein
VRHQFANPLPHQRSFAEPENRWESATFAPNADFRHVNGKSHIPWVSLVATVILRPRMALNAD